jgi:hypothetical protein
MKLKLFLSLLLFTNIYAKSCWNLQENVLIQEAELEGNIILSFKDIKTCKPIVGAKVTFANESFITNQDGYIYVPSPPSDMDLTLPLVVSQSKYITLKQNIKAVVGSFWQNRFVLTPSIPIGSVKFILGWGESPRDLDLHLVSDDFHISYRNKSGALYKAKLDRDATQGYGPEVITLNKLDKNKTYKVYVHQYSSQGELNHNTNITVYKNNSLNNNIYLNDNLNSRCVEVLTIHNNQIKYHTKDVAQRFCKK